MLVSLEVLVIGCCDEMHGVIGEEDEEISQEDGVGNHREIALERTNKEFVFPKLSSLSFVNLQNLGSFSGSHREDCDFKFPSLTQLEIWGCPELKKLCSGKLDAPLLKKVKVTENTYIPVDLKDRELSFLRHLRDLGFAGRSRTDGKVEGFIKLSR
ncbi:unnamed protein product [Coffea canephora]|uniref:DH200=94 genomic scaffold, scaffold_386 n=1 Tax=Coffea canephora TaxID=49390 RepID=A0A068VFC8_COFCA|nr:unnamed protein product [Coffea canephora]